MTKEEAWRILELLKDEDFTYLVRKDSPLGRVRELQLQLLEAAYKVLAKGLDASN